MLSEIDGDLYIMRKFEVEDSACVVQVSGIAV